MWLHIYYNSWSKGQISFFILLIFKNKRRNHVRGLQGGINAYKVVDGKILDWICYENTLIREVAKILMIKTVSNKINMIWLANNSPLSEVFWVEIKFERAENAVILRFNYHVRRSWNRKCRFSTNKSIQCNFFWLRLASKHQTSQNAYRPMFVPTIYTLLMYRNANFLLISTKDSERN